MRQENPRAATRGFSIFRNPPMDTSYLLPIGIIAYATFNFNMSIKLILLKELNYNANFTH